MIFPDTKQPDGAVLFHLDAPQVSLGLGDLLLQSAALLGIEGVDTGDDQVGVLNNPLDLVPYRLLQPLRPDVGDAPGSAGGDSAFRCTCSIGGEWAGRSGIFLPLRTLVVLQVDFAWKLWPHSPHFSRCCNR